MNNKQRLKFFWKITKIINKKFCKNKLKIKDIIFFRKKKRLFRNTVGIYVHDFKVIMLRESIPIQLQIKILCHELAHVYERQIIKIDYSNIHKKRLGSKKYYKCAHNKKFHRLFDKFLKEVIKNFKIDIN